LKFGFDVQFSFLPNGDTQPYVPFLRTVPYHCGSVFKAVCRS